ncbi:MAG: phage tail sheath C-terminal domain-containing protein [Parafilimonas sp.]
MSQINESAIKTPGVYVTEIPSFPPSIAQVATAVPAFIGYTEMAQQNGNDLTMVPAKISSFLEYITYFGGAPEIHAGDIKVQIDSANNNAVKAISIAKQFFMYDSIRSFYDNGGGNCYIVSVGNFSVTAVDKGDETATPMTGLRGGIKSVEKYDEPTILLFPDAVLLSNENDFYSVQQMALEQCASLGDRVCIFDIKENIAAGWEQSIQDFRDQIGINNLNYGNAYTPWIITTYSKDIGFEVIQNDIFSDAAFTTVVDLTTLSTNPAVNSLITSMITGDSDTDAVTTAVDSIKNSTDATVMDGYNKLRSVLLGSTSDGDIETNAQALMAYIQKSLNELIDLQANIHGIKFNTDYQSLAKNSSTGLVKYLTDFIALTEDASIKTAPTDIGFAPAAYNDTTWLAFDTTTVPASAKVYGDGGTISSVKLPLLGDLDAIMTGVSKIILSVQNSSTQYKNIAEQILYQTHPVISNIINKIEQELSTLPPSGAVAGVYSTVDGTRGVWKAPANVSLNSVIAPSVIIDDNIQDDLNIDVTAGKSINAIRAFTGKGTLVWGARTLDGNSNDFRYISVRRFYIMVEESVQKAAAQFVFEPNDGNTWVRIRAMIENYLTNLWRLGALAGSKPEQAFYVKVGLGQTMTFDDILNGKMIVEIGMAPVRPAEFIILRFSQIQQQA